MLAFRLGAKQGARHPEERGTLWLAICKQKGKDGARHPVGRRAGNENGAVSDGSLRPKGVQSLASKTFANRPLAFSICQQGDPDGSRIL